MSTRAIDSLESFEINGCSEWVLLRGNLATKRVLLIVQQGPGFPLIQDARVFEQRLHLEVGTVVAYWDQRGTGESFRADPATITLAQSVADVRAVVDALCARLNVNRVDVLASRSAAHSPPWRRRGTRRAVGHLVSWPASMSIPARADDTPWIRAGRSRPTRRPSGPASARSHRRAPARYLEEVHEPGCAG